MMQLLQSLLPIVFAMVFVIAASVYVFLTTPGKNLLKFILIPSSLAATIAVPILFVALLGYSVSLPLPEKFVVISHNIVIKNSKKEAIEIWASEKGTTRLFKAPYSKELEKQLKEAEKGKKKGMRGHMTRKKGNGPRTGDESPFQLDMRVPEMPGKDAPQEGPQESPDSDDQKMDRIAPPSSGKMT